MVALVFYVAAAAYLDRSNISIAAPLLKGDFDLTDIQLGLVFSAFVLGYAVMQPIAGRLADRFGAYLIIAVGFLWWGVLTAVTAAVPSGFAGAFAALVGVRLVLGVGESVIFPASNRLVKNWIPSSERGLANGLVFAGVGAGAGIAPPLISSIMIVRDWRYAFWMTAAIGLVVLVVWLFFAREAPEKHGRVCPAELVGPAEFRYILGSHIGGVAVGVATPLIAATAVGLSSAFLFTAAVGLAGAVAWLFIDPHAALDANQAASI